MKKPSAMDGRRFYFALYYIIPTEILVFIDEYDIFFRVKNIKINSIYFWSEHHAASIFS
jgi:hypothetical protein